MSEIGLFVEAVSGRKLTDAEDSLPDPSFVINENERAEQQLADERSIWVLRMILCGTVSIFVRPLGQQEGKNVGKLWAGQVGLATWCGMPEGKALLVEKRVIELGATLGLVGAAAYNERLGDCAECCLTTFGRENLENLMRPDAHNGCEVMRLNWYDFAGDDGTDVEPAAVHELSLIHISEPTRPY